MTIGFVATAQNSSDNWKVYLNKDTVPLHLCRDTTRIIHQTNPKTDYLTFIKVKGKPTKGKIQFISGKGVPSGMNYPLPIKKYKIGEPAVVYLKDVAENFLENKINGLIIQLVEVSDRIIRPIVLVEFRTN